jgi:hypothetical protein
MPWLIKAEFRNDDGKKVERTERIPAQNDVTNEITTAFRNILFQALAEAADDNSDLTVTVAFVGEPSHPRSAHVPAKGTVERMTNDGSIGTGPDRNLSAQPCGCDPAAGWTCEQHRTAVGA